MWRRQQRHLQTACSEYIGEMMGVAGAWQGGEGGSFSRACIVNAWRTIGLLWVRIQRE